MRFVPVSVTVMSKVADKTLFQYLYRVLKGHCELPEEGLAMIRYHSFYPYALLACLFPLELTDVLQQMAPR